MEQTLTLNDGTVLAGHAFEVDGVLYVYIDSGTLKSVFPLLSERSKTAVITAEDYGSERTYEGYTKLFALREETDGTVNACLRKRGN